MEIQNEARKKLWQTNTQQKNSWRATALSGKVTLFAKVTILPGDELSYHEHHGETEVYHILSGEGLYQDNDKTYPVEAEMTTFCEDGNGHAISCKGDEPLVFLAMIQKKEA